MKCPKCGTSDTSVLDSRIVNEERAIRRRRECDACGFRFTTFERVEGVSFTVVKKDGTREPYMRSKVEEGIFRACTKRPITIAAIEDILGKLEEHWMKKEEVNSKQIGEDVMESLKALDSVAYIRFASVYRRFKDVDEFQQELHKMNTAS